MDLSSVEAGFWCGRRVLVTGHTGFKGAWCALWLSHMGARVIGFALPPGTNPSLYDGAGIATDVISNIGDVRDREAVRRVVAEASPEIVLHFAAQSLVRRSLREPVETIATNVLGTTHLLDSLQDAPSLRAALIITTDKVYANAELGVPFRENDDLGGSTPYAASKAAAEIVTRALAQTYFNAGVVATARGGNVIGGGDYSEDRLVPDVVRAVGRGEPLLLRYPDAVRPWQHVLDCLAGYFVYVQALIENPKLPRALNVGPGPDSELSVREVAEFMLTALDSKSGWRHDTRPAPHEERHLSLDTSLIRSRLGWQDRFTGRLALQATAAWYRGVAEGTSMRAATLAQIDDFMNERERPGSIF